MRASMSVHHMPTGVFTGQTGPLPLRSWRHRLLWAPGHECWDSSRRSRRVASPLKRRVAFPAPNVGSFITVSQFPAAMFIFIFQLIEFSFCQMGQFILFCVQGPSLFCVLPLYVLRPTQKILTFASCVFSALYLFFIVCFIYSRRLRACFRVLTVVY